MGSPIPYYMGLLGCSLMKHSPWVVCSSFDNAIRDFLRGGFENIPLLHVQTEVIVPVRLARHEVQHVVLHPRQWLGRRPVLSTLCQRAWW